MRGGSTRTEPASHAVLQGAVGHPHRCGVDETSEPCKDQFQSIPVIGLLLPPHLLRLDRCSTQLLRHELEVEDLLHQLIPAHCEASRGAEEGWEKSASSDRVASSVFISRARACLCIANADAQGSARKVRSTPNVTSALPRRSLVVARRPRSTASAVCTDLGFQFPCITICADVLAPHTGLCSR